MAASQGDPVLPDDDEGHCPNYLVPDDDELVFPQDAKRRHSTHSDQVGSGALHIQIDGMDQAKFTVPSMRIELPDDDDLADTRPRKKFKKPMPDKSGKSRRAMLGECEMIPVRVPYLWSLVVPGHLQGALQDDAMEAYSPRRILDETAKLGLRGNLSADLLTGWDFTKYDDRIAFVQQVKARRPRVLAMSPPCTAFCQLMVMNWWHMSEVRFRKQV